MSPDVFRNALILTGPTGSGKSRLSVAVAARLGAEIISMDSMALYRGMDVGTAKPGAEDRARVPHHLVDVLQPWESASVAWWLERAADCCRDVEARGKRALFVGGTPLYLKALLHGLFDGPPADEAVRQRLALQGQAEGNQGLHQRLRAVDPASAARLHPNDVRRVIRALEVWELTGKPISSWQQEWRGAEDPPQCGPASPRRGAEDPPRRGETTLPPNRCLWLDLPRAVLYNRIDARVVQMIADGLVEEVRALTRLVRPLSREARQALGYKEVHHLEGRADLEETVARIQTRSRQFAKRQLTWFRQMPECRQVTEELTFALWGLTM